MEEIFINIVLILFPILMYLVFSCFNVLTDKKIERVIFIITIITSVYLSLEFNHGNTSLLLFCNIPVLICYFKKEGLLGIIISLSVIVISINNYNVNGYIVIIKYLSYFITYILLYNKKEFNYLFFKISAIIQGLFISMEYFTNTYYEIEKLIDLFIYIVVIYSLTFFSLYLFKLANNVSDLYNTVKKIKEDNNIKDSLFKLTHEIKNPIAVCKGYLDMINLDDEVKSRKYINIIKSEIDRSLNVISDFMEYSKIKINKELLDMGMLLDEIYESFSLLICDKNITFNYKEYDDEIYLEGDYDRLKQVFVNIIKNSIESIEEDGIINMDIKLNDDFVTVTISDNGIGMDSEEIKNVKEMFYTTKKNGTGLGIALSNEIIVAHGGELEYESVKNKGTKCIVKLPL